MIRKIIRITKRTCKVIVALGYLTIGLLTLLISRKNLKPVYRGFRFFMDHESYQITLRKIKADPATLELIETRYRQYKQVRWDLLRKMPQGSLGYEFAKFMNNPDVTPLDQLPEAKSEINPEIDYLRQRIRLIHDIHHVLCGFPADELGEMGISAYYVAQVNSPLNSILLAVGLIKCTIVCPHRLPELMTAITEGWTQGQGSTNLFGIKYEEMWEQPVTLLRERFNLKPSHRDFISEYLAPSTPGLTFSTDVCQTKAQTIA